MAVAPPGPKPAPLVTQAGPVRVETLLPTIVATLRRMSLWNRSDLEDLVQTALERVIRSASTGGFRGECSMNSWAASIAANAAVDYHRHRRRERNLFVDHHGHLEDAPATPARSGEHALIARAEAARLQRILSEMKPEDAEVVLLRNALGFSVEEVARELGRSQTAIESRLVRARAQLRRRMLAPLETASPSDRRALRAGSSPVASG